jgi:putative addiction module component (TIGR02574 family)
MAIMIPVDIGALSDEAKLDLITQLWDSIESRRNGIPYAKYQRRIVAERLKAHAESPDVEVDLETFRASIYKP